MNYTKFLIGHPVIAAAPFDNALLIWKRRRARQRIFRFMRAITRANSLIGFHRGKSRARSAEDIFYKTA